MERQGRKRRAGKRDFGKILVDGTPSAPRFSVRWWEAGKQRRRRGFLTKGEAQEFLAKRRVDLGDGTAAAARRAEVTFLAVGQEWLELHSKALRSHDDNVRRWNLRIAPFFGSLRLSAVTVSKVLEFKASLLAEKDLADGTRNQYLQQARAVLRYAVHAGYLASSPTDRTRGLMIRVRKAKLAPPIATTQDVGRLLEAVAEVARELDLPSYPALFATAAYTGMRRGELCGLRWSDIDLGRRLITVRNSHAGPTKSGRERMVPIPSPLLPILKAWKLEQDQGAALVFPNDRAGSWGAEEMHSKDSAARLARHLAEACKRARLPVIRFHDLRHTFASHYAMSGGNLLTLQRILGHSSPVITSETYSHLSPDHLVSESDRFAFGAPAPSPVATLTRKDASR